MLTPEQKAQLDSVLEQHPNVQKIAPANDWYSKLKTPKEEPGYFERVGSSISKAGEEAKTAIESGAEKVAGGMIEQNPIKATGKALAGLGEAALGTAGAATRALFSPLTEALAPLISPLIEKGVESSPKAQEVIKNLNTWAEQHPEAATNLKNVIEIATSIGGVKAVKPLAESAGNIALKTGEKIAEFGTKKIESTMQKIGSKAEQQIGKDIDNFITSKKSLDNQSKFFETQKGTPVREMIKDKNIFEGLKVENGTINPDKAIEVVSNRIDTGMNYAKEIMPEVDKYAQKISKNSLRTKAYVWVQEQGLLPADAKDVIQGLESQLNSLPDEFLPSQLDFVRAMARKSARNAKGIMKRDSEYSALESAARDLMFDAADKLPTAMGGEFGQLRTFIKQNIDLQDFLEKNIRGQKVKGGRLGTYTGRIIGGITGSTSGPFGAIVGQEVGARIADILSNNTLGSSIKLQLVKKTTDNPQVLKMVEDLIKTQKEYKPLMIEAKTSAPIELPGKGILQSQENIK